MNYNTILSLFGLDPNNFKHVLEEPYDKDGTFTMFVEQRADKQPCPYCNSEKIFIKDYNDVTVKCTTNRHQIIELCIKKVRFKCGECKKTFTPKLKNVDTKANITNTVKQAITLDFSYKITFSDIARNYNVSVGTVFNLFDNAYPVVDRGTFSSILCIDEFHFSHLYDQKYCCVLIDFNSKQIIDILKNRRKEYLNEYFMNIPKEEREKVRYFISDMYDEYAIVKKKFFQDATHIIDRFHVVSQLTKAINKRRNTIMKKNKNDKPILYSFMKTNWELFERSRSKIPNKTYRNKKTGIIYTYDELLSECLKLDYSLNVAYDELQNIIRKPYTINDAHLDSFFTNLSQRLINTEDEDIKKVGNTYKKWKNEIINAYTNIAISKSLSNSIAETTNNHIKTIIKISYGLSNFDRLRKRSILISRSKKTYKKEEL